MNNNNRTLHLCRRLTGLMLWAVTSTAFGADRVVNTNDMSSTDAINSSRAQIQLQQRFIREFSEFAGSTDNARSLYGGLRSGSRITLSMPTTNRNGSAGTSVVQFNPAARPMGNGSAFISMALAKQQLANHGIARPVPGQIQAALNGGTIIPGNVRSQPVALKGVLAQREQGLGWGVIAKASGISLGKVLDGVRNPSTDATLVAGSNAYANAQAVTSSSRHAEANGVPGTMHTSANITVHSNGLLAQ